MFGQELLHCEQRLSHFVESTFSHQRKHKPIKRAESLVGIQTTFIKHLL